MSYIETWGFHTAETSPQAPTAELFLTRAEFHAYDYGIKDTHTPSPQLQASRTAIFNDVANELGVEWQIVDGVLRIWHRNTAMPAQSDRQPELALA